MTAGNTKESLNLLGQLVDCEENDPARCELFIIEGDLAGESCKLGRDHRTQAILPFSAEKASVNQIFAEKGSLDKMLSQSDIKSLVKPGRCDQIQDEQSFHLSSRSDWHAGCLYLFMEDPRGFPYLCEQSN
jgi:DNA gyrase/topoisomerase IV subunit B